MSKPAFSFGLKKSGLSKPVPARGKPSPFNGGDNDGSGDEAASNNNNAVQTISELDGFVSTASAPSPGDSSDRRKKKSSTAQPAAPQQPPQSKRATQFGDLSSALTSRKYAASAEQSDPSIYDYDAAYDSFKAAKAASANSKKSADAADKQRPRYFDALQKAADVRERDRQIAEERRLQRERAAEGDAFADKEKFVTEAYRRQQEANRQLEEEEKRREEEERKKNKGRGLADFYRGMLERGEEEHAALVKAAEEKVAAPGPGAQSQDGEGGEGDEEKSAAERAREINAMGGNVLVNEDGEVVDKRQLLKGGLNVAAKKKAEVQKEKERQAAAAAAASKAGGGPQSRGVYAAGGKQAMRERQTRMLEAQLEETLKRSRQEEAEETAKIELASKSRKTAAEISSAKERYLARKRAAEEAKKKGLDEGP
ncbi:Nuclear speckle splicing regulatory protein 1 [Madurella mycetomatis]|uniref:Nuclear speckle splicing regulatory protein 1 n=1 Tax=Madurella mycetomatis TaxID=100816 RepID=A0A175W750_9PEZI|nr:Nuclear speckle splicing regulatory protein 1 [Madurella mycetomatis]